MLKARPMKEGERTTGFIMLTGSRSIKCQEVLKTRGCFHASIGYVKRGSKTKGQRGETAVVWCAGRLRALRSNPKSTDNGQHMGSKIQSCLSDEYALPWTCTTRATAERISRRVAKFGRQYIIGFMLTAWNPSHRKICPCVWTLS